MNNDKPRPGSSKLLTLALLSSISIAAISTGPIAEAAPGQSGKSGRGIVGTGALGEGDVSAQGIVGTGALGIVGTGALGDGDASAQGIVGTGALGIVGTGALGDGDASTQGIVGTGALGIVGTGVVGTQFQAISDAALSTSLPLVLYGPVDEVLDDGYVILGQRVWIASDAAQAGPAIGDTVAVFGLAFDEGILSDEIVRVDEKSVDGSSWVFVAAIVSGEPSPDGSLSIGTATVKIGSAGSNPSAFAISSGDYVEISGVRLGETIIAEEIWSETSPQ
jgi:hypothetical protein